MYTYGQFRTAIRGRIWPAGLGEAANLVASHDADFIDALVDLQTFVGCLQEDNTEQFPQCSTTYNCGLTVFPMPRGIIKQVSVIDRIDPITFLENPDVDYDYCSEVAYVEVDFCHVRNYLNRCRTCGSCIPLGTFFGLPFYNYRPCRTYPTPTDEGLVAGLPPLPMGFHYPQESTDRTWGRAGEGVWAKDRGNIYIAPWIQSTEMVLVKWDGIKRSWNVPDPIDQDPLLSQAVEQYVRWQHELKWGKDQQLIESAGAGYATARAMLIHQCREETRARGCEPSQARASTIGFATLYYNDEQSYTASCPEGETGDAVTRTVAAGTVGSNVSVSDANRKAKDQAISEAEAMLVCSEVPTVYWNDTPGVYTASCAQEDGAPVPDGHAVTVTIQINTISSTVSVAAANAAAQAEAQSQAENQLQCTFYNREQPFTKSCPDGTNPVTAIVPARSYHSNISQADADQIALNAATSQANQSWAGTVCGAEPPAGSVANTERLCPVTFQCGTLRPPGWSGTVNYVIVNVTVPAAKFYAPTQAEANALADGAGNLLAINTARYWCAQGFGGTKNVIYPGYV